jgi:glycosyltransferase involved in cell wall biosynthesis
MRKVSIIVPVYNEENTIKLTIESLLRLHLINLEKEIIVVNDGSTDSTGEILLKYVRKCIICSYKTNKGKGFALREGFKLAKGDIILIQDADLEYPVENYKQLLSPFKNLRVSVVYGSRFLGSHLSTLFLYELGNKFVTFITNLLYNTNITDMETGAKVFRREVLDSIKLSCNTFDFEPEFTAQILKTGFQIYEVPISYLGRTFAEGKKLTWKDGILALFTLIKQKISN